MATRLRREDRGYTLVEFAVAMGIFLIFISIAAPFMFSQLQGALETEERVDLQQNARTALRTMIRELRQADRLLQLAENPSGKNELSFAVNWDGDNTINGCGVTPPEVPETVTYYVQNGALQSGCKKGDAVPLAEHVGDIEFTMFGSNIALDADNDGVVEEAELGGPDWTATELANVTRVQIELTMVDDDGEDQAYFAEAFLRNRVVG